MRGAGHPWRVRDVRRKNHVIVKDLRVEAANAPAVDPQAAEVREHAHDKRRRRARAVVGRDGGDRRRTVRDCADLATSVNGGDVRMVGEEAELRPGRERLALARRDPPVQRIVVHRQSKAGVDLDVLREHDPPSGAACRISSGDPRPRRQHARPLGERAAHVDHSLRLNVAIGARGRDLDPVGARLDLEALVSLAEEGQIGDLHRQRYALRPARGKEHLPEALEPLDRPLQRRIRVRRVHIHLHDLVAGLRAGVLHVHADPDRVVGGRRVVRDPQVREGERRVAQAITERIGDGAVEVLVGAAVRSDGTQRIAVDARNLPH